MTIAFSICYYDMIEGSTNHSIISESIY